MGGVYVPRSPTTGVLYGVVRGHWSDFAADVRDRTDGVGLPAFVVSEFRNFLRSGVLVHGFARVRCAECAFERLVPRSAARAAASARAVAAGAWASAPPTSSSTSSRPTSPCANYHRLCRTVLSVFVRALPSAYRRQAKRAGLGSGETGMVTSAGGSAERSIFTSTAGRRRPGRPREVPLHPHEGGLRSPMRPCTSPPGTGTGSRSPAATARSARSGATTIPVPHPPGAAPGGVILGDPMHQGNGAHAAQPGVPGAGSDFVSL
jgi:hypothetical protein